MILEDQRDAGTDQIREAESWRDVVLAAQQPVEPVVLFEPQARFDDDLLMCFLWPGAALVRVSRRSGGEHGADLDSVAVKCLCECMAERIGVGGLTVSWE